MQLNSELKEECESFIGSFAILLNKEWIKDELFLETVLSQNLNIQLPNGQILCRETASLIQQFNNTEMLLINVQKLEQIITIQKQINSQLLDNNNMEIESLNDIINGDVLDILYNFQFNFMKAKLILQQNQ